jgi:hypothetical protein
LKLAHQWNFIEVKSLAVRELENLQIPPLPKIVLYQKHAIDRKLLQPALTALTIRDDPLTYEEGREITLETALDVAKAREIARSPVFSGKKSGNPRSPINLAGAELDAVIKDVFHFPSSNGPDTSPSTSGRDNPQHNTQKGGTGSGSHQCKFLNPPILFLSADLPIAAEGFTSQMNGTSNGFNPILNGIAKGGLNGRNPQK